MSAKRNLKAGRAVTADILLVITFFIFLGCASGTSIGKPDPEISPSPVPCSNPRPEICTQDYIPVCGKLSSESHKTYSNACNACADLKVVNFQPGPCP